MARTINVHEAKTHLSRLLEDVKAGEEVILAKRGIPYAKLVPVTELPKRKLGFLAPMKLPDSFFEPLPEEELKYWK